MTADQIAQAVAGQFALVGQGRFIHMGRRFRHGGSSVDTQDLLLLLTVLAVVATVIWLLSRYSKLREKRAQHSPRRLFHELCRAHKICWADRKLLRQLARWHQLPHAAQLFVAPERFDPAKLSPAFGRRAARLAALRGRLFGG